MTPIKTTDGLLHQQTEDCCLGMEEQRDASLPADRETEVDEKSVVVLTTEELTPVHEVSSSTVDGIVHVLTKTSDWLQLYEAVVMLRRIVAHHSEVVTTKQVEEFLRP
ncbi:hypothetical protein PF002_g21659, partial [Phytophthora fragariae]